jgi:hypothetical protein
MALAPVVGTPLLDSYNPPPPPSDRRVLQAEQFVANIDPNPERATNVMISAGGDSKPV